MARNCGLIKSFLKHLHKTMCDRKMWNFKKIRKPLKVRICFYLCKLKAFHGKNIGKMFAFNKKSLHILHFEDFPRKILVKQLYKGPTSNFSVQKLFQRLHIKTLEIIGDQYQISEFQRISNTPYISLS